MRQNTISPWAGSNLPGFSASPGSPSSSHDLPYLEVDAVLVGGRYRVLEYAGEGKHGTVYRAEKVGTKHMVAIKVWQEPEQGRREAALLGELQHPMLPALIEMFAWGAFPCLAMEWVGGPSLLSWSSEWGNARNHLPLSEIIHIGLQLAEVFDYLHGMTPPIWFRDLHAGNVLRLPDGRIKLIDFGLAQRLTSGEAARRHIDISDIRLLLSKLLPPSMPNEFKWRLRGEHPSIHPETAQDLRVALEALRDELGLETH